MKNKKNKQSFKQRVDKTGKSVRNIQFVEHQCEDGTIVMKIKKI